MNLDSIVLKILEIYTGATAFGVLALIAVIFSLFIALRFFPLSKLGLLFEMTYEKAYDFFEEILGKDFSPFAKTYVVVLFFVILISNMLAVVLEFLAPIFGMNGHGGFLLEHYITVPSSDINFNIALAVVSMIVLLGVQFSGMGGKKFLYDYLPVFGKGYISVEKGSMNKYAYYPVMILAKTFDIIISLFLAALEIIGIFAKIVSLSFRLFGNMTSGTVLLGMLIVGMSAMTEQWTAFMGGFNFPIILPIFVYLQEILVALIQAIVFPLLVAVFMKVANSN